MNYANIYNAIVDKRRDNKPDCYCEQHHILPRSLGGADTAENLVDLTAREHFICHWLLLKMYPTGAKFHKMLRALVMMSACNARQERYINSKVYARLRSEFASMMSSLQRGENNSQFGTMWICNIELQINKKVPKGLVEDGWVVGRNKWVVKPTRKRKDKKPAISKMYKNGFAVSVDGVEYCSISKAADALAIGHETARMRFKSDSFPQYKILSR